ncbi:hypothetical protein [Frigoriglobus tundricola]|uniref:Uncharacterized protein n=1 Tax=Frigoriglobus tundricola TaxID=2774151 RepID=A0A6M5YNU2_9BACT|nr:hypothetical protein [Frigoriglobus tundricola]QJW94642.1 hypothetical protein FTUN_2164 [Frigoriglobus tundricola]
MLDRTLAPTTLSCTVPHAEEVRAAQAAVDAAETGSSAASVPGANAGADLELLRRLVAAYGVDGVHRMIESLR